jgi:hypothetical protein
MGRPRYELWEWPTTGPNGEKSRQWFRVGGLAPELQKDAKKIPVSAEVEEDYARHVERREAEKQNPEK